MRSSPITFAAITDGVGQFLTLSYEGPAYDLATRSLQPLTSDSVIVTQHDIINALKRKGSFNVRSSIFSLDGLEFTGKTYDNIFEFIRYAKVAEGLSDAAKVELMAAVTRTYGFADK